MPNYTETEAYDILIRAVNDYLGELSTNGNMLVNAANVCDAALGSDAIAQKHIARLNEALDELQKTAQIAEEVAESLIYYRQAAIDVVED